MTTLLGHLLSAEMHGVVDEELAAEQEEQDDTRDHLGDLLAQAVERGDGHGALLQDDQQEGEDDHDVF